jgi:hypothetical protein
MVFIRTLILVIKKAFNRVYYLYERLERKDRFILNLKILLFMSPPVGQTYVPNPLSFFKKNQIDVKLEKYAFSPGETIKGSVGLKLKRPVNAKKLTVALIGLRIVHQGNIAIGPVRVGNQGQQTQMYTIYHFEIPLDEDAVYYHELYPFEIQIPRDILQSSEQKFHSTLTGFGKTLSEIAEIMNQLSTTGSRVEWSVEARLYIPLKVDIVNAQKIVLSEQKL